MISRWIQSCQKILEHIRNLEKIEKKDRLEYVRSIRFMLGALHTSLTGWMQWVNSPDIMTQFTEKDLKEMSRKLTEFTRSFIEYDLDVTKKGADKGLKAKRRARRRRRTTEGIYI